MSWAFDLRRSTFGLAALVAIALQSFVVQTHVDGIPRLPVASVAEAASTGIAQASAPTSETQSDCIACEALATSGRIILAADASVVRAKRLAFNSVPLNTRIVPTPPAHTWNSRAPPTDL